MFLCCLCSIICTYDATSYDALLSRLHHTFGVSDTSLCVASTLTSLSVLLMFFLLFFNFTFLSFFLFFFYNCIFLLGFLPSEIRVAFHGESQLRQSRATQPKVHAGCFSVSIINPTNSDMNYRVFNVRTDANACDCTRGCTDTIRESALKVDSGRKIPSRTRSDALPTELHPHPHPLNSICLCLMYFNIWCTTGLSQTYVLLFLFPTLNPLRYCTPSLVISPVISDDDFVTSSVLFLNNLLPRPFLVGVYNTVNFIISLLIIAW